MLEDVDASRRVHTTEQDARRWRVLDLHLAVDHVEPWLAMQLESRSGRDVADGLVLALGVVAVHPPVELGLSIFDRCEV